MKKNLPKSHIMGFQVPNQEGHVYYIHQHKPDHDAKFFEIERQNKIILFGKLCQINIALCMDE